MSKKNQETFMQGSLQVFFEDPFWVGVFEQVQDEQLSVCKVTFGAEPREYEVEAYLLEHFYQLRFSPSVDSVAVKRDKINPKRLQREVKKQMQNVGIGTKSQQALKLQQEQFKTEKKVRSKEQKEQEAAFLFALRQQKKKEKHKGR